MEIPEDVAKLFDERHYVQARVNALATLLEAVKGDVDLASLLCSVLLGAAAQGESYQMNDLAKLFEKK